MSIDRLHRRAPLPARTGIVHLGPGAFFRAFGVIYAAEAMARSGGDWAVLGVSLRSPATRDALAPQDYAYTALELGPDGEHPRVVEALAGILVAPEDPEAVLAALSQPDVRIVSLTVTEKGYCHKPSTGELDPTHPDILHDIAEPLPVSAPGFIVRALERRWKSGMRPFTVLSCDNLSGNGRLIRRVVMALAGRIDPALAAWIETEGRFPSTMVDRIVPATKAEDIDRLAALAGYMDMAPVLHEPFRQWVIEDDFVDGARPDFAAVGVQLVADVTPFENMKLRMLNAAHSALAYLGLLAGHATIADAVADPVFAAFIRHLWSAEIIPALVAPPGVTLADYAATLFDRFANPAIRHQTRQIATDGSQKLPQRLLPTLAVNLEAGRSSPAIILAIAGWMRCAGGVGERGEDLDIRDPLAGELKALSAGAKGAEAKAAALLALRSVFPETLARAIGADVAHAYRQLERDGARATLKAFLETC